MYAVVIVTSVETVCLHFKANRFRICQTRDDIDIRPNHNESDRCTHNGLLSVLSDEERRRGEISENNENQDIRQAYSFYIFLFRYYYYLLCYYFRDHSLI